MEFWQFLHFLKDFIAKHQNVHLRLVEAKANGAATLSTLKRKISGFEPWQAQGKMVQAVNTQPMVKSNHIFFQMVEIGVGSVPIVFLVSLFMGMVLAMQTAYQLQKMGALMYVGSLVAVSMTREIG